MTALDRAKARTCKTCRAPMVPRRPGRAAPDGYRTHGARGECSTCFQSPSDEVAYEPVMWPGRPVGEVYQPTFHRYAPPPPWTDSALCAQVDPEMFFPEKGGSIKRVKAICEACPVVAECLDYALANREQYGVWGGKSEPERAEMLRKRPA